MSHPRRQRTIAGPVCISGVGLFTNAATTAVFRPAAEDTGVVFRRTDLFDAPEVPALIEYLHDRPRRTVLSRGAAYVEMTEHALAAMAGLRVDNCVVEVDGPELPGMDGSSEELTRKLLDVGIVRQDAPRAEIVVERTVEVTGSNGAFVRFEPPAGRRRLEMTYSLDHPHPAVGRQAAHVDLTPRAFAGALAAARTFVMLEEVEALRAAGYGLSLTEKDLCVFGPRGVVGNTLRFGNEPARHKLLDCVGDFALCGRDVIGRVTAYKSGHALNHAAVRQLLATHADSAGAVGPAHPSRSIQKAGPPLRRAA